MSEFLGANIDEIRVYEDPSNPNGKYIVVLPITVLEAVRDVSTGKTLKQILSDNADAIAAAKSAAETASSSAGNISSSLANKADKSHTHTASEVSGLPTSLPANGGDAATVNGHSVDSDVPTNAKFTDTTYSNASASAAGLVSTGAQTFSGNKTFNGQILPNGASAIGTAQARKISCGTAAATTSNCAAGCWYGQYE